MSNLSILAVVLGAAVSVPQVYGLTRPAAFSAAARSFPRSYTWGVVLMLVATAWFVWNVSQESIADFAAYKGYLLIAFAAIGLGACVFVRDFLAVRALAVILLLLGKLMVDTGRPVLDETSWVLLFQAWAYVLVIAGMWLTISPWRLRDLINWSTADERRIKTGCAVRLTFGLAVAVIGLVKF